jgi:beta-galactosidase
LNESGEVTPKFTAFRDAIARVTSKTLPAIPQPTPARTYPIDPHPSTASLWQNLPKPVERDKLLTMEDLDQAYGYILYRTQIAASPGGKLVIDGLHDYAQIYVDQKLVGTLDRRLGQSSLTLPAITAPATLDILVENSGRVNFTKVIRTERKGITGSVTLAGAQPQHWKIYSLPMTDLASLHFTSETCEGPCFYRFSMTVPADGTVSDTFLNTQALTKGIAFLNDSPLGRFWSVGPQVTLYTPGPWLKQGSNQITVFDLQGTTQESLTTTDHADYGPAKSR